MSSLPRFASVLTSGTPGFRLVSLDTAYKNWVDSITGKRADKVKQPKFKNKSQRQSARFTKGSFSFENGVLNLSKIGDIHIPWYRRVQGEPSSVLLSMTPSGRYYVVSVRSLVPHVARLMPVRFLRLSSLELAG